VIDLLYRFLQGASPHGAEYVSVVGHKSPDPTPAGPEVEEALRAMIRVEESDDAGESAALNAYRAALQDLNEVIDDKNRHITHLESVIKRQEAATASQQATIERQAALLKRIESGRVMRLLNRLTRR
jgi:hypothetical protein